MNTLKETLRGTLRTIYCGDLGLGGLVLIPAALVIAVVVAAVLVVKFKKPWLFAVPVGLAAGLGATAVYARVLKARAAAKAAEAKAVYDATATESNATTTTLGTLAAVSRN